MNKEQVYKTVFETIKNSTEWGIECKDKTYGHWIDGVIALADNLINEIKK